MRFKPSLTAQVSRAVQEGNAPQGRVAAGREAAERLDIEQGNAIVAVSHLQVNNSLVLLIYALSLKLLFLLQSSEVLLRPYSAIGGNGTRSPRCEWT